MFDIAYHVPNLHLFVILCVIFITVSAISVFLISRFIPIEMRYKDNGVIGNISSLISIIYGVLVGITALYLINNLSYTSDAVQREANATADIYRDSRWLTDPARTNIQNELKNYLTNTIQEEWPVMKAAKPVSHNGDAYINKMAQHLDEYKIADNSDSIILRSLVEDLKNLYDSREQRLHMSHAVLNTELWIVILIGTILTVGINYLFGMNYILHYVTVSAVTLMAVAMIFLLITLDRPFQGEFVIEPDALQEVLNSMQHPTQ